MMVNSVGKVSRKLVAGLVLFSVLLVWSALDFPAVNVTAQSPEGEWTQIVLIYQSDVRAKIEPCG
jgi:hypothetical protein